MENNSFLSTVLQKLVSQPAHAAPGTQSDAGRAAPGDLRTLDPWIVEDFGGNTSLCLWAVGSLTRQCQNLTTELSQHAHA